MYEQNVISLLYAQHTDRYVDKHVHLTVHIGYLTHKAAQLAIALSPELEPRVILGGTSIYEM